MLVVSSDGPLALGRLDLDISANGKTLLSKNYRVPQEVELPTTVAIVSNGDPSAVAQISVTGWQVTAGQPDVPLDRRDTIVRQIPVDRVAALTVVLSARCSDKLTVKDGSVVSTCDPGETCDNLGDCTPSDVPADGLPTYQEGGAGSGSGGASSNGGSSGSNGGSSGSNAGSSGSNAGSSSSNAGSSSSNAGSFSSNAGRAGTTGGTDGDAGSSNPVAGAGEGGMSSPDPCSGVTCDTQKPAVCRSTTTSTSFAATGTCVAGDCAYASTDKRCDTNQACAGAGVCSVCKADTSCGAGCAACNGLTPKCKDLGSTSVCVACVSNAQCSGSKPICNSTTNVCEAAPPVSPSCVGLAATCGANGNASCCASTLVTGVSMPSFYRSYDGVTSGYTSQAYPAQVSDFRLDTYEITVGRFRKFWQGYPQNLPAEGSGKNRNSAGDSGWDVTWNSSGVLPATQVDLTTGVGCNANYETFTAGNDNLPMNCITWFEAQAFCIWDGGRLPTEAEWDYAAAGGTKQWIYPWGNTTPGMNANLAVYGCFYPNGTGNCVGVPSMAPVGSILGGNGLYGQSDLAGNIWEWVQDWYGNYPVPCTNCANLTPAAERVNRGGNFGFAAETMITSYRSHYAPGFRSAGFGARCARAPNN